VKIAGTESIGFLTLALREAFARLPPLLARILTAFWPERSKLYEVVAKFCEVAAVVPSHKIALAVTDLCRVGRVPWTGTESEQSLPGQAMEGGHMSTSEKQSRRAGTMHIRWMIRRDMPEVLRIEQASHDYPWCEEDFLRCLRQRNCIGMVAEQGEKVVGFMIYELHKTKLHILNFAVHSEHRRNGIGAQMAEKLVSKLSSHRRTKIMVEVRETSLDVQLFYRSAGFRATGVARDFYSDSGEDAYVMEYRLAVPDEEAVVPSNRISQHFSA
jgi:ribosomal-protein-alanine N-acetyltransferase